jgi:UDP-2,3-diacylglucosamine pyrophosphatase LpxH
MHLQDELLTNLFTLNNGKVDVRLVASLQHDCIGFQGKLKIFLPDVHLVTRERRTQFNYGTNYEGLLTNLVLMLKQFRASVGSANVTVYQLGDLLDLWRQDPQASTQDIGALIANDHQDLMGAVVDSDLATHFLLGNHDFNLCRFPNFDAWAPCEYLEDSNGRATAIALHGHLFDWQQQVLNVLPEPVKDALVYLFAPAWPKGTRPLGELIALNNKTMEQMPNLRDYIQAPVPVALGRTMPARNPIPPRFNVQTEADQLANGMMYAAAAKALCENIKQKFGTNLNMVVIGHTHHARIAVIEEGADAIFTLVDAGAWIEQYSTPEDTQPHLNAQIAAIGDGMARIYQLEG